MEVCIENYEALLKEYEVHLLKYTSFNLKKYVTKNDCEYSVALLAFKEAIEKYNIELGDFKLYLNLVLKRRLIDYIRQNNKFRNEISIDPFYFSGDSEEFDMNHYLIQSEMKNIYYENDKQNLKDEIDAIKIEFEKFDFSFYDLVKCSPKSKKTKKACAEIISFILRDIYIIAEMYEYNMLPIKKITENVKVPRKLIERHRKYIIAAVLILDHEYHYLGEYLSEIRKELVR